MSTLDALQAVLAGEHACVYGYGALGPHAAEQDQSTVNAAYDAHPLDEPDEWGDLASFRRAVAAS